MSLPQVAVGWALRKKALEMMFFYAVDAALWKPWNSYLLARYQQCVFSHWMADLLYALELFCCFLDQVQWERVRGKRYIT